MNDSNYVLRSLMPCLWPDGPQGERSYLSFEEIKGKGKKGGSRGKGKFTSFGNGKGSSSSSKGSKKGDKPRVVYFSVGLENTNQDAFSYMVVRGNGADPGDDEPEPLDAQQQRASEMEAQRLLI